MMIILIHHWLREFSPVCGKPFSQHHNASEPWRGLKSLLPCVQWGSSKHNDVAKPLVRLFRVEACDQSSCMACWNASHAWQMCWASGSFKVTQKGAPVASSWSLLGQEGTNNYDFSCTSYLHTLALRSCTGESQLNSQRKAFFAFAFFLAEETSACSPTAQLLHGMQG